MSDSQSSHGTARLMDGAALARHLVEDAATRVTAITARTGRTPCLTTLLVGDDPASATYVGMMRNRCNQA
jgi:methylenetetrahydrofolate dehydrogenase (NADP+)/methenyltetrahydrofolate cyclohydrolase